MLYIGRMLSLTSLVGQALIGRQLYDLEDGENELEESMPELPEAGNQQEERKDEITKEADIFGEEEEEGKGGLRKAVKQATHGAMMGLLFQQFEGFEELFIDEMLSILSPCMAHVELKAKFRKESLGEFLKDLQERMERAMFREQRMDVGSEEEEDPTHTSYICSLFGRCQISEQVIDEKAQEIIHMVED